MWEKLKDQIAAHPDEAILWSILLFGVIATILLVIKWQLQPKDGFDIRDLIRQNGKLSGSKVARMGAFAVSTWCFVYLAANDKLSEWYFMGYMAAWVGNALFNSYLTGRPESTKQPAKGKEPSPKDP